MAFAWIRRKIKGKWMIQRGLIVGKSNAGERTGMAAEGRGRRGGGDGGKKG